MNDSFFTPPQSTVPDHRELHRSQSGYSRLVEYTVDGGRRLVIKTIRPDYGDCTAAMSMLRREYELSSSLYHNGVVQIFEWQNVDGIGAGIVMERVDGVTLTSLLASGEITPTLRLRILDRILTAVEYIHTRGIVHRDLKPDNIMVNPATGDTTIIDFGLAARIGCGSLPGGTPPYSSPEQMADTIEAHPTADIHAIGHLMIDLFGNSRGMSRVAQCCTHPTPGSRPQSVAEVRRMIAGTRRRKLIIPVIAGILMAGGAVAAIIISRSPADDNTPIATDTIAVSSTSTREDAITIPTQPSSQPAETPSPQPTETATPDPAATSSASVATPAATPHPHVPAVTPDNIENRVRTYATQCAEKYFAMHIQALDTARQRSTIMMGWSENWIFGAERACNQWLEKEIGIDHPDYGTLRQTGINAIKDYRMRHAGEHKKALDTALTRI